MRTSLLLTFVFLAGVLSIGAEPWLQVSVDEIGSASPIKGIAVMPVRLATAAFQAVPPKYQAEALKEGFDLAEISQDLQRLPVGQRISIVSDDITVRVAKFDKDSGTTTHPSSLVIKIDNTEISCPLLVTGVAIKILTVVFKDLKPVEEQLKAVMFEAKTVPPGRLLWCTDRRDTIEVSLK